MDPLSIQMGLGTPPSLRGKISLSSIRPRKKKPPEGDNSSPLNSPTKLDKIDEDDDDNPQRTPTRNDNVRTRRGFRPLSVLTNNILSPFAADTFKAMEELERKNEKESTAAAPDNEAAQTSPSSLTALPKHNGSEVSLHAFLAQSAPTCDVPPDITGPFSDLYLTPAPDISQHPAYSPTPFKSQSDSPSLITTSSPKEIAEFAAQTRGGPSTSATAKRGSTGSDVFTSAESEKKKFVFFDKVPTPTTPFNRMSTTSTELTPLTNRKPKSCPIEIPYTPSEVTDTSAEKRRIGSGGLRKISDMFKPKASAEKPEKEDPPSQDPAAAKKELEEYLRRVTCSPTYPYTETSWMPRHPNTQRFWRSRNLKCTVCSETSCACCGRTCCAYKAAVMALETHKDNPDGRQEAFERIQQITSLFPYGRELPTFLQCTKDVMDGRGCGKYVCPDCCGICPEIACRDTQCRKCKKNPWADCDWHSSSPTNDAGSAPSMDDEASIHHTV